MKKLLILALAVVMGLPLMAQQNATSQEPTEAEQQKARESANWYIPLNYGGIEFEVPAGSIVEKNSKMLIKYPDGTFGVSMENEAISCDQKLAYEKARMYANKYKLSNAKVNKVTLGGIKGAKATGRLESHDVTVLILPVSDQQITTVLMATPDRQEWADHFQQSIKH